MATAGIAAADVGLSGYAEMGLKDTDADSIGARFHTDIDVTFRLSGETANGLSFGATIDLDEVNISSSVNGTPADGAPAFNNESVFIRGAFGTVTMGDTDGAFDWAMTEVAMLTSLADDHTTHAGYSGNSGLDGSSNGLVGDGLIARYDYAFGAFAVGVSAELDSDAGADSILGLGVKWSGNMGASAVSLGFGYQDSGVRSIMGLSGKITTGGIDLVANYSDLDGQSATAADSHMALGVGYAIGDLALTANYGVYELVNGNENSGFGLAANYDLGGGAVIMVGYGDSDRATGPDTSTWSAGLGLSF